MSCCKNKVSLPKKTTQAKNLILSVANILANAIKTGRILANEELIKRRVDICKKCSNNVGTRCTVCGCFLNIKVGVKSEKCPINHW